jgi:hypothetical protein
VSARDSIAYAVRESRELMAAVTDQRESPLFSHCGFCGAPCVGPACGSHRDIYDAEAAQLRGRQ